jgi:hypothetical protein
VSRYEIPARNPAHQVFVGWDPPLQTMFLQVYDARRGEEENPVVWIGADRPRQLYDIEDLRRALAPHADLPHDIAVALYGDRDEGR